MEAFKTVEKQGEDIIHVTIVPSKELPDTLEIAIPDPVLADKINTNDKISLSVTTAIETEDNIFSMSLIYKGDTVA